MGQQLRTIRQGQQQLTTLHPQVGSTKTNTLPTSGQPQGTATPLISCCRQQRARYKPPAGKSTFDDQHPIQGRNREKPSLTFIC
jgi:hypothetical protein